MATDNAIPSQYFRTKLRELVDMPNGFRPLGDWLLKNVQNCNELMDTWCEAITNDTHDAQHIYIYLRAINVVLAKKDKTYMAKISSVMEPVIRELVAGGRVVPHTDVYDKIKSLILAWRNEKSLDANVANNCLTAIQPERILHYGGPLSWADEVEMDDPFVTASPPRTTQPPQQQSVKKSPSAQEKFPTRNTQNTFVRPQSQQQSGAKLMGQRPVAVVAPQQQQQQQVKGVEKLQQRQTSAKVEYGKVTSPTTAPVSVNTAPAPAAPRGMSLEERVVFLEKVVTDQNLRIEKYHRQHVKMNAFIKELRKEMAQLLQRQLIFERGGFPSPTVTDTKLLRSIPTSGSSSMSSTPRTPFSHYHRLNPNAMPFLPDSASDLTQTESVSAFSSAEYTDDADLTDDEVVSTML